MLFGGTVSAFASGQIEVPPYISGEVEVPPPHYGEDSPTDTSPYTFSQRVDQMTPTQQLSVGVMDPFMDSSFRTFVDKLCFISSGNYDVYTDATGSTTKGFVSIRESVFTYQIGISIISQGSPS